MLTISENEFSVIKECCKTYDQKLKNHTILFIYLENNEYKTVEVKFFTHNFYHLTGAVLLKKERRQNSEIVVVPEESDTREIADKFYEKVLNGTMKNQDLGYKGDGTTKLKISILNSIVNIEKTANMYGKFNINKNRIIADDVLGNYSFALGILNVSSGYVPVTSLKEHIKHYTDNAQPIMAVYKKRSCDENGRSINLPYKREDLCSFKKSFKYDNLPLEIKNMFNDESKL